jgi:hypothetical protein
LFITLVFVKNANFSPKFGKNRRKLWSKHRPQEWLVDKIAFENFR